MRYILYLFTMGLLFVGGMMVGNIYLPQRAATLAAAVSVPPLSQENPVLLYAADRTFCQLLLEQLPGAQEPQRDNAYAALLDCCALEDGLMQYLIEVLRTGDAAGFYRLARVTTRTDVKPEAFLAWLGSLEDRAEPEERECAQIMDGCLRRLVQEGRGEVAAALISGDEQTFTAFRREAPELRNRPEATVEWFLNHYVDTYYPIRFLLAANGVEFPKSHKIN